MYRNSLLDVRIRIKLLDNTNAESWPICLLHLLDPRQDSLKADPEDV